MDTQRIHKYEKFLKFSTTFNCEGNFTKYIKKENTQDKCIQRYNMAFTKKIKGKFENSFVNDNDNDKDKLTKKMSRA